MKRRNNFKQLAAVKAMDAHPGAAQFKSLTQSNWIYSNKVCEDEKVQTKDQTTTTS